MPHKQIFHSAYPSLAQHPLGSAFVAIFWAILIVAGVAGTSAWLDGSVHASQPSAAETEAQPALSSEAP